MRKIIIDCDPGQDDAIALLLAFGAADRLDILGITTVAGNVPLALTEKNARKLRELAGREDVPVMAGCERPFLRKLVTAEYIHGETGLDGADLPEPRLPLDPRHGVDFIIETLLGEEPGTVTLCPTGPLTNIAMAFVRAPQIMPRVKEIVLMGGGWAEGNVTPVAEFNIYVDPHAAAVVFDSGIPITMLGLDVTHKALVGEAHLRQWRALGTPVGDAAAGLLDFYSRYDRERYGVPGAPLHDPCVIAYLLAPELFSGRMCNVTIETASELTMGQTVIDWWRVTDRPANAHVITDIDADGFFALLLSALKTL